MFGVKISSLGIYIPSKRLSNFDLEKMIDTTDEWITQRTGIKYRYIVEDSLTTSDLALNASLNAISNLNNEIDKIDLIILATNSPDYLIPSTASVLHGKLKNKTNLIGDNTGSMDVFSGCTAFVYALITASSLIKSGVYKNILLVGAESISKLVDWTDRTVCVLLGDGAGSFVLSRDSEVNKGLIDANVGTDGDKFNLIYIPVGGVKEPPTCENLNNRYLKMIGREVFKIAITLVPTKIKELLDKHNLKPNDIKLYIFHQANLRIINGIVENLGIDSSRVYNNIDKYANTSAASVPIVFYEAFQKGFIKEGDLILFSAFGAGFTWANVLWRL
ncbi:MAG: 3-oxoacyl-ACP synthase III family protein [bacterium]